jgi:hypothetical protein
VTCRCDVGADEEYDENDGQQFRKFGHGGLL